MGTSGYDDLHTGATTFDVGRVHVHVASLADIVRSKTAAGRPKDFDALPELHQLAGSTTENDGRTPEATPGSARELAHAGYPDPIQPVTTQELAQARIDAARGPAASRADGKQPPTQR
jgi:hypothetical protein